MGVLIYAISIVCLRAALSVLVNVDSTRDFSDDFLMSLRSWLVLVAHIIAIVKVLGYAKRFNVGYPACAVTYTLCILLIKATIGALSEIGNTDPYWVFSAVVSISFAACLWPEELVQLNKFLP